MSFSVFAQTEPPQFMSVDGRLYDSANPTDPLLDNSVVLIIQVLNPAKTCILYEEQQTVSTLTSNGYFNVRVGSPNVGPDSVKRSANDSGNNMATVFQNQASPVTGKTSSGLGCSYTPAQADTRYFRFIVTPSTTGVTSQLSPDMTIDSVPQSLVAESLQGLAPDDFIRVNANTTQAKADNIFGASYTALTNLIGGTSSLYLQNSTNGTVIPNRATDPVAPTDGQIWFDTVGNVFKYYDGSAIQTLGSGGADPSKLPLAGGTMSGNISMGGNQILGVGHITQMNQSTITIGRYTNAQETTLITTPPLTIANEGLFWFNSDTNELRYWDGAAAQTVASLANAGDINAVNTNAGSGLSGGVLTGAATLQIVVDNTGIEINGSNQLQIKDLGVTDAKITGVGVQKIASGAGNYFTYAPNNSACTNGQILVKTVNGWECGTDATGTTDHGLLGGLSDDDHTQYVLLAGRAGGQTLRGGTAASEDLTIDSTANATKGDIILNPTGGNVGIGTTAPASKLDVDGTIQIGDGGETCSSGPNAGMIRYNGGALQYCNGSAWQTLGVSGSGLTTLNGQTGNTQTFAVGSTGTAPAWSSATDTHTLNIPLASGVGVTSGTITKAEYDSFVAKLSAVAGSTLNAARIWVGDGANLAQAVLMSGDATLSNTGALTIANDAVTSAKIAADTIVAGDIATGAVETTEILDGTIATVDIADDAITTAKILNSNVTDAKIATVGVQKIASGVGNYFTYAPNNSACTNGQILVKTANGWECGTDATGATDHGLLSGLTDDDHTQYVMLAGRAGGQILRGGTAASEDLTIDSTANATKGDVLINPTGGNVGIGTTAPASKLDVDGTIQIGDGGETCSSGPNAGMIRYNGGNLQYCNGSSWQTLGVSGAGLTTLNGQTGNTQTFAVGTTGTAPAWSSATDTHTLNIPLASGVGVTSGTITKAEYDSFVAKLSAVTGSTLNSARIWVGDGSNQAQAVLMSGDATLSNTGALTIANDAVTSAKIAADTIVAGDIATGAVETTEILDGTIATVDIADDAITTAKILNSNVTDAKIATVGVQKIASGAGNYFTYAPNNSACTNGQILVKTANGWECGTDATGASDHGALAGLGDDDHTQYVMLAGRAGGQILRGGTAASEDLTIDSTANATKGDVLINPTGGNVGIGSTTPSARLNVVASGATDGLNVQTAGGNLIYDQYGNFQTPYGLRAGGFAFFQRMADADNGFNRLLVGSNVSYDPSINVYDVTPNAAFDRAAIEFLNGGTISFITDAVDRSAGSTLTPAQWNALTKMVIRPSGNVGIGTLTPASKLDVEGTIQIGDGGETCSSGPNAGMIRYNGGALQYCNGSAWQTLGVSGSGLTTLNGQTGNTQTFAVGATGTAPAWSSATDTHTLNIPLASGVGVTSGTITKAEYDSFVAKLSAVTGSTLNSARIWVGDGSNQAQAVLMSGDATLSNTGALTIANDAVTSAKIAADTIVASDIATGAVETTEILDGTIATVDIADDAITTAKILNSNVTDAKIAGVGVQKIASGAGNYFTYAPNNSACTNGQILVKTANGWECGTDATGASDHGVLTGLLDDDHTQYVMLAGRTGGQTLNGGTAAGDDLTIDSTANATKGDVLINPNGGNVGIGTTLPSVKLEIVGNTYVRGSTNPYLSIYDTEDNGGITIAAASSAGAFSNISGLQDGVIRTDVNNLVLTARNNAGGILFATGAADTEKMRISNSGNVGIGTTNPASKFTVINNLGDDAAVQLSKNAATDRASINFAPNGALSGSNVQYHMGIHANTNDFTLNTWDGSSWASRLTMLNTGSVGIGTATPSTLLDVAGAITARPTGVATGQTGQILLRELAANGTKTVTLRSPDAINTASYALTLPVDDGASGQVLQTDGNGILSWVTALASGGNIAAGSGTAGAPSLSFSGDPNTGFYSSAADTIGVSANGAKVFDISSAGIVSPAAGGGVMTSSNGTAATPTFSFAGDLDTGWFLAAADTLAASTGGTERMRIDSSGNVGIGTTAPVGALTVQSSVLRDGNWHSALEIPTNGANNWPSIYFSGQGTDRSGALIWTTGTSGATTNKIGAAAYGWMTSATNMDFYIDTNDAIGTSDYSTKMIVKGNGNVGIGTTSPATRLDVSGTATFTDNGSGIVVVTNFAANDGYAGGSMLNVQNSSVATNNKYVNLIADFDGDEGGAVNFGGMGYGANSSFSIWNPSGNPLALQPTGGNVGIGDTTPEAKVDIYNVSTNTAAETSLASTSALRAQQVVTPSANQAGAGTVRSIAVSGYTYVPVSNTNSIRNIVGTTGWTENYGTGSIERIVGLDGWAYNASNVAVDRIHGSGIYAQTDNGTVNQLTSVDSWNGVYGGTVAEQRGLSSWLSQGGTGTVAWRAGLYLAADGTATNDFGVYQDSNQKNYFSGSVGIGTTVPTAKLEVQGQIVSREYVVASGGTANFSNGNAIVLSSVGGSTITVSNMVAGGVYNIIVEDTTSRTYTFSGCTTSYFSPANGATSNRTVYTIYRRGTSTCFITWTTGFN